MRIKQTHIFSRSQRSKRHKAVQALLAWQKKVIGRFEGVDYRALIEDGRRY